MTTTKLISAEPDRWPPAGTISKAEWQMPGWGLTIGRGVRGRCPHCGLAPIFDGYLKVHAVCAGCAAPLGQMPSDDAPPYIAMVVMAHLIGVLVVLIFTYSLVPGIFGYGALVALVLVGCAVTLRMAKGATIGILLKLGLKREALS